MKLKFIVITLFFGLISFGQSKGTVKGIITDKDFNNEPLPFANVVIKGTSYSSSTDEKGNYSIVVPAGNYTIEFSFLGYESIEEKITIKIQICERKTNESFLRVREKTRNETNSQ